MTQHGEIVNSSSPNTVMTVAAAQALDKIVTELFQRGVTPVTNIGIEWKECDDEGHCQIRRVDWIPGT